METPHICSNADSESISLPITLYIVEITPFTVRVQGPPFAVAHTSLDRRRDHGDVSNLLNFTINLSVSPAQALACFNRRWRPLAGCWRPVWLFTLESVATECADFHIAALVLYRQIVYPERRIYKAAFSWPTSPRCFVRNIRICRVKRLFRFVAKGFQFRGFMWQYCGVLQYDKGGKDALICRLSRRDVL